MEINKTMDAEVDAALQESFAEIKRTVESHKSAQARQAAEVGEEKAKTSSTVAVEEEKKSSAPAAELKAAASSPAEPVKAEESKEVSVKVAEAEEDEKDDRDQKAPAKAEEKGERDQKTPTKAVEAKVGKRSPGRPAGTRGEKKTPARAAVPKDEKKATVGKTPVRRASVKREGEKKSAAGTGAAGMPSSKVILEYYKKQVDMEEVRAKALEAAKKAKPDVQKVEIYVVAEQNAAYYVVDGEGKASYRIDL